MKPSQASTQLCAYDETQIFVRDQNLCEDLIGKVSFTRYLFFLTLGRFPSQAEETIVDAALVMLAEHGLTPSVIAARLTYMGAPESLQGAVAAGLLGVGDQFVGTVELVAPLLQEIVAHPEGPDKATDEIVTRYRATRTALPGFGQPHHKPDDPRSPALFAVAERMGASGKYVQALKLLGQKVDQSLGRHMTINAPGAMAAVFLEIGVPLSIMRGFVLISRCAGLVAHLHEEQTSPAGRALWTAAGAGVSYTGSASVDRTETRK